MKKYLFIITLLTMSCSKENPNLCSDGILNGSETRIDCGGECGECLSSQNEIIEINFAPSPLDFQPVININNDTHIVCIKIGKVPPTTDISDITFDLIVSEGATIANIPSNYIKPQIISVIAEDGSEQDYKVILSGAYGTLIETKNGITSFSETKAIYQRMSTTEISGHVNIILGTDFSTKESEFYQFEAILKNKNLSTSLVGQHELKFVTLDENRCGYTFYTGPGSTISLPAPQSGKLIITDHDLENKVISGKFDDLKFGTSYGGSNVQLYPYAEFINLKYN